MGRIRRFYYDIFSSFYDFIIDLHSKDRSAGLRDFLVESSGVGSGSKVLDICTGTGSVALRAAETVNGDGGKVVALDFSRGMLKKARDKIAQKGPGNLYLVQADVSDLPFAEGSFDCVTCSHAMYELTEKARKEGLGEIRRVLREGGSFFMMEHEVPERPFIRFLYYVRLTTMGSRENRDFARDETVELSQHFTDVRKSSSPTGKSKLITGRKSRVQGPESRETTLNVERQT
jgi:demethylmenaquinone methyltransferase/2-methoxy-6-polyprenyl-1,4-benzoquinol methylase